MLSTTAFVDVSYFSCDDAAPLMCCRIGVPSVWTCDDYLYRIQAFIVWLYQFCFLFFFYFRNMSFFCKRYLELKYGY